MRNWAIYKNGETLKENNIDSMELKKVKQNIAKFSEQNLAPYDRNYDFVKYSKNKIVFRCLNETNVKYKDSIINYLKGFSKKNKINSIYLFSSFKVE